MTKYKDENFYVIDNDILSLFPLNYMKNYLRIDNDCDDDFLKNAIATACNYAENITGKLIGLKTFSLSFLSDTEIEKIDKTPFFIKEVTSVYINNVIEDECNYYILNGILYFKIPIKGKIQIIFKAGTAAEEILLDIRQAIMFHVAAIYNNKDGNFTIPQASQEIYNNYRLIRL